MGCEPMSRSAKPRVEGGADRAGRRVSGPGLLRRSREASSARAVPSRVSARGPGLLGAFRRDPVRLIRTRVCAQQSVFARKKRDAFPLLGAFREVEY